MTTNSSDGELRRIQNHLEMLAHTRLHWGELTPADQQRWSELCERERELIGVRVRS